MVVVNPVPLGMLNGLAVVGFLGAHAKKEGQLLCRESGDVPGQQHLQHLSFVGLEREPI